jgi:hypothetical protein
VRLLVVLRAYVMVVSRTILEHFDAQLRSFVHDIKYCLASPPSAISQLLRTTGSMANAANHATVAASNPPASTQFGAIASTTKMSDTKVLQEHLERTCQRAVLRILDSVSEPLHRMRDKTAEFVSKPNFLLAQAGMQRALPSSNVALVAWLTRQR